MGAEAAFLLSAAGCAALFGFAWRDLQRRALDRARESNRPRGEFLAILRAHGAAGPPTEAFLRALPPGPTLYDQAIEARIRGEHADAADLLRRSLEVLARRVYGPGETRESSFLTEAYARLDLSDSLERIGDEAGALVELRRSADRFGDATVFPGSVSLSREMRARIADRLGRHEEQVEHLGGALHALDTGTPGDRANYLLLRAGAHAHLLRFGAAFTDAQEAAELRAGRPEAAEAHNAAALYAAACGAGAAALDHGRRALEGAAGCAEPAVAEADARCTLALAHLWAGRLPEAWDECRRAREALPDTDWLVCLREGGVLSVQGRDAEALEALERADAGCAPALPYLARRQRAAFDISRASLLEELRRHGEADAALVRAADQFRTRPHQTRLFYAMAAAWEAERQAKRDVPVSVSLRGRYETLRADLRAAMEAEARRPGRMPGDGIAAGDVAPHFARAAYHLGDVAGMKEALDVWDTDARFPVSDPARLFWRGRWHRAAGDGDAARESWLAAVEAGPETRAAAEAGAELAALPTGGDT